MTRLVRIASRAGFWLGLMVSTVVALAPTLPDPVVSLGDVVLHLAAFIYLAAALCVAYYPDNGARAALWLIVYGIVLEIAQGQTDTRTAELGDIVVDAIGIAIGLIAGRIGVAWLRRAGWL